MNIKFKDINIGAVQARATIEIMPGVYLNEITILKRQRGIDVELPQKSFKGKNNTIHYLDIISFESEDKKNLWLLEIKSAYKEWRNKNPKVLVYEQ